MITTLLDWLDHRVGIRKLIGAMLLEDVPGGAKWRYVWGSCLAFVFSIQLITGILLMTAYSPSSSQAWSSVHFIQYKMDFGWLIRGLHHFGSQTMMVLIGLHMLQVVIAGAHLPPREVNWWLGMGLLGVTFGLSLTGYLLPWDQKGFWATRVATNIASNIPVVGPEIRQLLVGGEDYGNHTLTRFYALHVSLLPGVLIVLMILHIYIFRRHGVTSKVNVEGLVTRPENEHVAGTEPFWPRQAFYDMVACMVVFAVMLGLIFYGHGYAVEDPERKPGEEPGLYDTWAKAGQRGLGANLDAAADRETSNYPARPEWYFLFLFQLLKYFKGNMLIYGTVVIPNGVAVLLMLLPLLGYGVMRPVGYWFSIFVMFLLLTLVSLLTVKALMDDEPEGILWGTLKNTDEKLLTEGKAFQESLHEAEELAKRACQLAMAGTPVEGGHLLLRNDPLTRGRVLFERNCGSCHNFTARKDDPFPNMTKGEKASDLGDFGSKEWIRGLLHDPMNDKYFGLVKKMEKDDNGDPKQVHALTGMRGWRKGIMNVRQDWDEDKVAKQEQDFDVIAQWLADQAIPREKRDKEKMLKNQEPFFNKKQNRCTGCHTAEKIVKGEDGKYQYKQVPGGDGTPDLSNYGSAEWIRAMIMRPWHPSRYGENNQMPTFLVPEAPGSELARQDFLERNPGKDREIQNLTDIDRELIIRFMLRDYRPVYGGTPIK